MMKHSSRTAYIGLVTAVLWLMFTLAVTSLSSLGPTFDEQGFLVRGLGYLRENNHHIRVGHPLGLNALNTILLINDPKVALPTEDPSWELSDFHRPAELFLWEIGNDVNYIMFLARLPTIWLGLLLVALAVRWARQLAGRQAGLLSLALLALDPNILAHTRLSTTDLGLAAGALVAGYSLWSYWQRPSPPRAVLAGIGFALLQNTKFTAGLFVPLLAIVIAVSAWRYLQNANDRSAALRQMGLFVLFYPTSAFLALWAMYGFQVGTLPENLPTFSQLSGLTLPLSHHLEQLLDIGGRLQKATPSFLLGSYSDSGWWYYFPVAFALKTPLPTLILLVVAVVSWVHLTINQLRINRHLAISNQELITFLLFPALGYFAFALTTNINLGYRHLLPIMPLLVVFMAVTLARSEFVIHHSSYTLIPLILWLGVIALWLYPHYLAFFNAFAGGPSNGWRALVDSNIDWGQDLPNLAEWMGANNVNHIWLSYFGEARPNYYGINYTGLDSFPPRLMNPEARPFHPDYPAPGIYAISATNLQGVHFANHDQFAYFREREPLAKVGYSIFIYEVAATGPRVELALGGVQPDEISPDDYAMLGSNDVTMHWFDPAQSLLLPDSKSVWMVLDDNTAVSIPALPSPAAATNSYRLYQMTLPPVAANELATFVLDGDILLTDVMDIPATVTASDTITFTSRWFKNAEPQPLKIFVHLTDADDKLVAQWDGLGVPWEGWRAGDHLWQIHTLTVPETAVSGTYQLWLGLYHPETGSRWQLPSGDRYLWGTLEVLR